MDKNKNFKDSLKEEKFDSLCTELSYLLTINKKQITELLIPFLETNNNAKSRIL